MNSAAPDTIVAVSTPAGRGALAVLRLTGPDALSIAERLCGTLPPPRQASLRAFRDTRGQQLDRGLLLCFPAPSSYTGEHMAELQGHGSPAATQLLLEAACAVGARLAEPGEFTRRAYLNGRLDLAQAEAVADLIDASHRSAVLAANRSLDGEFSRQINALVEELIQLRSCVEGALDFSDEDVDWLSDARVGQRTDALRDAISALMTAAHQGRRLREGMLVAIAGAPNVGKSTLLNRMAGTDAAIVTDIPGTTRDLLREQVLLDGLPLTIMDTAGLRESDDPVEQEGVRRARRAVRNAELVIYLLDDRYGLQPQDLDELRQLPGEMPRMLLWNKSDLSARPVERWQDEHGINLRLSAQSGEGMALFSDALRTVAGFQPSSEGLFTARTRHLEALKQAAAHLDQASAQLQQHAMPELAAEELRLAQAALSAITGAFSADDLLGRIFSSFCIGK